MKNKKYTLRILPIVLIILVISIIFITSACNMDFTGSGVAGLPSIPPPPQTPTPTPEPTPEPVPEPGPTPEPEPEPTPEQTPEPDPEPTPYIGNHNDAEVDNIMSRIDPSRPMIALTFDDGPGNLTNQVLDILEQHGVVATFFVIGRQIESHSETVLRAYNMGSEIANHTWSHRSLEQISADSIRSQLQDTSDAIESVIGVPPLHMRPPYGRINSDVESVTKELGLPIIFWAVDPSDYLRGRTPERVYDEVMENVRDRDIILLHDIHERTIEATRRLIPSLISQGYQFVTVSELMHFSDITLVPGESYKHGR